MIDVRETENHTGKKYDRKAGEASPGLAGSGLEKGKQECVARKHTGNTGNGQRGIASRDGRGGDP